MDKFLDDMMSAHFWLSVVAVGVAINLFSPLVSRAISATAAKFSSGRMARTTAVATEEQRLLQALVDDPAKIEGERDRVMRLFARAAALGIITLVSLLLFTTSSLDAFRPTPHETSIWSKMALIAVHLLMVGTLVSDYSEAATRLDRVAKAREKLGTLLK